MTDTILIVEDEPDLREMLEFNLRQAGFEVISTDSGRAALRLARGPAAPAVVLLDLMLPDGPGTEVCRALRADAATRDIGVIMVTAKASEIDRVVGFEIGADDYVVKPYSVRELVLRVRSLIRRRAAPVITPNRFSLGGLRIDRAAHAVWVRERAVALTALEFRLLVLLVERRGQVQTRERLLEDVWDMDGTITTRTVDTHVKRLREKLGECAYLVETVRGVGYRVRADDGDQ
jgi:two-component system phosphate regulon response regulator PhoB